MDYAFYPGCAYEGAAGYEESVNAVCRALGVNLIELPDWNCCGATAYLSLDKGRALALTARVAGLTRKMGFDQVVVICNACYATLRKGLEMLEKDPEARAKAEAALAEEGLSVGGGVKVRHLLEVFDQDAPEEAWAAARPENPPQAIADLAAAGYYGCQLTRPWGDVDDPTHPGILERVLAKAGATVVEHSAKTMCCGASHATPYADACRPLIDRVVTGVSQAGADVMTTICPMCQFNMDAGQKGGAKPAVPATFFTQVLGLALGLPPRKLGLNKLLHPVRGLS